MSGDDGARGCGRTGGRRIAVRLEYDGSAYRGSQFQENGPSIQAELESAIAKLTGETVRAAFAGRTDSGVHALGQVAAFDTGCRLSAGELVRGLDHFLPEDIAVLVAAEVPGVFDPRRDATGRTYRYRIHTAPVRSPMRRSRVWHVGQPLDVAAMSRAAQALVGAHDFAAFAPPFEGSTSRTLRRCDVSEDGDEVAVEMEAQAFLPHQVRRTVGALVEIGLGRQPEDWLRELLQAAKPSSAGPAAPPCGLYLVRVAYDGLVFGPGE
ncbi:MAG: tRNA pseudouridine(38-40) synthase TruA [Dehalococcoidia bacterium]